MDTVNPIGTSLTNTQPVIKLSTASEVENAKPAQASGKDHLMMQRTDKVDADKAAVPTAEELKKATDAAAKVFAGTGTSLHFQIDDSTKETVVKIVDSKDGRVIKQIPSKEMLDLAKSITEMQDRIGKLFKEKV